MTGRTSPAPLGGTSTLHACEHDRLESLWSYGVLDTPPEPVYDDLARMAAALCGAPSAAVTLIDADRLWVKAKAGMAIEETPRAGSFCAHVVMSQEPLTVTDAAADPQWRLAADYGIRAYAGVPLIGRDGLPLGALCVVDGAPRSFSSDELGWLRILATQVVTHMELQRADARAGLVPGFDTNDLLRPERIRAALDQGELVPYLQPIVDLRTGAVCGAEALLRWEHPDLGLISPAAFIPMLEATGLMLPVGRHVLRASLRSLRELYAQDRVAHPFGISVNISALQASQPGFARTVIEELEAQDVAADLLTVELTETGGPTPVDAIRRELEELREAGVKLDADDFGNGHSTLQRVLDLPLTAVKLDMSIVGRIAEDPRIERVIRWVTHGAHDLGLDVVAEGVETEAQRDFLRSIGCNRAQGYLFGRAVPLADFAAGPVGSGSVTR